MVAPVSASGTGQGSSFLGGASSNGQSSASLGLRSSSVVSTGGVQDTPAMPAWFTGSDGADGAAAEAFPALDAGAVGGLLPGIQYEEARAHANDRTRFTPGSRVEVPFRPRPDDGWPVNGKSPRVLPAGRLSGQQLAQGSEAETQSPAGGPSGSVDQPSTTGSVVQADPASFSTTDPAATSNLAASSALRRQIFGFLPYWNLNDSGMVLNYNLLSTIAYFSVGADRYGNLRKRNSDGSVTTGWGGWTSSRLTSIITAAHQKGTRVVLTVSVFAWTSSQASTQAALLASSTARLNLARQVAKAVHDRGADGVNLDFEPIVSGYSAEFTAFVRSLRTQLNSYASGYQLTFDTTGRIGNYPIENATAPGGADAIFIMGYDYRGASSSSAGSIDPLTGPSYDLTDTVAAFTSRVAPSKLILGVPYYGRAWSTVSGTVRSATHSGTKYGTSVSVNYENVVPLVSQYGRKWDSVEQSPWLAYKKQNCSATYGCVTTWRQVYYDDAASLGRRYDLVNRAGLRGVGMWALGYDGSRPELYQELGTKFLHDTTAPLAGIRNLATKQRDAGFVVTWRATDDSNIARYDVQVSVDAGAWTSWLTGTTAASDVYLGADGHGYAFRARATDSHGNVSGWNVASVYDSTPSLGTGGFGRVRFDGLAIRAGHDTSAAQVGTLNTGDVIAITGGPLTADGYTWYQFTGPISEWQPVNYAQNGVWVASSNATTTYVAAALAPNATLVDAGLRGLSFSDAGGASLGSTAAASALRAFSPNGDGSRDRLRLRWTNTVAFDSLTLKVWRLDGTLAGSVSLPDVASGAQVYDWNGSAGGATLPDGRYLLQLVGVAAGLTYTAPSSRPVTPAQVAAYAVTIDRVAPTITAASISSTRLSPDGDGRLDSLVARVASSGGATHWTFTAAPLSGGVVGAAVRTINGAGASPSVTWNGRNDAASAVPDGTDRLRLAVADPAGNSAARVWDVTVRSANPVMGVSVTPVSFSPNGDGADDRAALRWWSDVGVAGTARVVRGTTLVRSWTFTTRTGQGIAWDGHDRYGHTVADGRYTFTATGTDAFGNRTSVSAFVVVDRTIGFLRWSPTSFYPQDGDSLSATSRLSFRLSRTASISLRIYDGNGTLVRTVWSNASKAAGSYNWTWNGKNGAGAYVPQGRYTAELRATSGLGTSVLRRAIYANAFTVSPSATALHAGQTLTVTFRSIEGLSTRPVVTFTQTGKTGIAKTASVLSNGSYRVSFTVASGGAGPATVAISAKDSLGHTNRGSLTVSVS
jgi:spore germination protein YaaH/flagellar hook assembly protein FlgD